MTEADLVPRIEALEARLAQAREQIARVFIGQDRVVDLALTALLCGGHALLVGLPGLGKTRLVHTLGTVMGLDAARIQFTPDLMPADILGSEVLETAADGTRSFRFIEGPVFCQLLMADEINRASPRTQSALLQAMQEQRVAIAGEAHALPSPFHVLATQNPIEQEGTYPLPEAQLDRFMFLIRVDYPTAADELRIARETTGGPPPALEPVLSGAEILEYQRLIRRVPVPDHVFEYIVALVRRSRPTLPEAPDWVRRWVQWGAGPRAVQYLVLGARAHAVLRGSYLVQTDDVDAVAQPVLEHRILTNFHAESEGIDSRQIIRRLIETARVG